ncbi:hypothetical protein Asp14428_49520 [Actinoplanes sp. NBRC 14428]|nr:hypothetical protein Asp14428_49520 [Actinoplanes sp. NBRC 14428]
MSDGIEFLVGSVLGHAGAVSEASGRLAQARSAIGEVTMDSQAYGQLCQFLPGLLSPVFDDAFEVISEAVEALDETAAKLRTTASAMEMTDAGSARRLEGAARPILDLPL